MMMVIPREPTNHVERMQVAEVYHDRDGRIELAVHVHFTLDEFLAQVPSWSQHAMMRDDTGVDALARFFRNAVLDAVEHEIDECIYDRGVRVFDPHERADGGAGVRKDPFRPRETIPQLDEYTKYERRFPRPNPFAPLPPQDMIADLAKANEVHFKWHGMTLPRAPIVVQHECICTQRIDDGCPRHGKDAKR